MEKEITEEDEMDYVRSVLKEPLTYEVTEDRELAISEATAKLALIRNVQHGAVFEIQPEPANEEKEEEEKAAFEPSELLQNMRLDLLDGGEDEVDPDTDIALPFERIASSMESLTQDRGVLKKVIGEFVNELGHPVGYRTINAIEKQRSENVVKTLPEFHFNAIALKRGTHSVTAMGGTAITSRDPANRPCREGKALLRKVIRPGAGPTVPPGSGVCFHYNAYLEMADEPFDSTRLRGRTFRCLLDNMIIPGLSIAVASMRKGEIARFLIEPQYAYGRMGCPPRIPANATILYEVELQFIVSAKDELELKSFMQEGDERHMPFGELLERCVAKRRIGNTFFEQGEHHHAIKSYMSAIRALEDARTANEEEDNQRSEALLQLYNNVSLCFIHTGKAEAAIKYAKRALMSHPDDARALYRVGVGLKMTGEFDSAARYLRKVLQKQPNSKHAAEQLRNIDFLKRQLFAKESDMCRRMFNNSKSSTAEEEVKRIVAMEKSGVTAKMKTSIRERLEKLKESQSSTPVMFTAGFSDAHFEYIRTLSSSLGLKCEDLPEEGVKVFIE